KLGLGKEVSDRPGDVADGLPGVVERSAIERADRQGTGRNPERRTGPCAHPPITISIPALHRTSELSPDPHTISEPPRAQPGRSMKLVASSAAGLSALDGRGVRPPRSAGSSRPAGAPGPARPRSAGRGRSR